MTTNRETLLELAEAEDAKKVVGQFTVEPWAGGWSAIAYQGGPGSSVCLFGSNEDECLAAVGEIYARGKVPMNAIPSSQYHGDALRHLATLASKEQSNG